MVFFRSVPFTPAYWLKPLMAQLAKNPPVMQETAYNAKDPGFIPGPGSGGSLEKEMATHSSILA